MSELRHTPAPWHVAEYGENVDGSTKFFAIKRGAETIANLGTLGNNTQLIAAAPELLEACRAIVALADGQGRMNMLEVAGMARRAIDRAEGDR